MNFSSLLVDCCGFMGGRIALFRKVKLGRLGRFCQLRDIIDVNDTTVMALEALLVPGPGFRVSSFQIRTSSGHPVYVARHRESLF
jgi:hypothetical protein